MRIAVTGATGFVGRALVEQMNSRNHRVVVLSRDPARAAGTLPLVAAHYAVDLVRGVIPAAAFAGVDCVVHLAGEPVSGRWTPEKKAAIRDSRVLGTRNLVDSIGRLDHRPRALVSASAIGFYGDRGDEELGEDRGPGGDFLATTSVEWETEAARAVDCGLAVASLRIGIVLDPAGGALQQMLRPFRLGIGGPLGSGQQWWSWIHREDLVRMICTAAEDGWEGSWNATAPHPVRQGEFARSLGAALGRPAVIPAPAFALKALFGEFSAEVLTSKRVIPDRALNAGFRWQFGRLEDALADLLP